MNEALSKLVDLRQRACRVGPTDEADRSGPREIITTLLDCDTFVEINMFAQHRCNDFGLDQKKVLGDGVVTGYGEIYGRQVFVYAQDFAVMGGSLGAAHAKKICNIMDLAAKARVPVIGLLDSGGARIQEGTDALSGFGEIFFRNTRLSGVIPQITAILGVCAGGAVYSPALTDFIFQVDGSGLMFITGPAVIKEVTGQEITKEELGGAHIHTEMTGNADFFMGDNDECLGQIRTLISYLPSNNKSKTPRVQPTDDPLRLDDSLPDILPSSSRRSFDIHKVINVLVDNEEFFEIKANFARNIVCGFGRMDGETVGIVANQPSVNAGVLDCDASDKAARFVRFCNAFNIPLVTLVDIPGYMPGVQEEYKGIIRHGAKLLYAYSEATVPKITVILRKAYGGAYIAMCSKHLGADLVLAWPKSEIAVIGPEGAVNIIYKKEIGSSSDPDAVRQQKVNEYREKFANPYDAAFKQHIDDVIDPRETRPRIISALKLLEGKEESLPWKKNGNIPV
ncbi:methylmalonyl-CoA carboxyltransferase 12S subunit [Peptococcaceae bacterium CEB3]|nr:methylmalonyl-CoA carboxyltransferase 12S subunit [Peptococcaceae bacterium CEB3]